MPKSEVRFLVDYLFGDDEGRSVAKRIDRHVDRLPGLDALHLIEGSVDTLSAADLPNRPEATKAPRRERLQFMALCRPSGMKFGSHDQSESAWLGRSVGSATRVG